MFACMAHFAHIILAKRVALAAMCGVVRWVAAELVIARWVIAQLAIARAIARPWATGVTLGAATSLVCTTVASVITPIVTPAPGGAYQRVDIVLV